MEYVNARTLKWNEMKEKKRETITSKETFVFYCLHDNTGWRW